MDEVDRLVIGVRADTSGFRRDVAGLRSDLEGSLGQGAERAGRLIEGSLLRAVRSGKLGFEDLKRTALSALEGIAGEAVSGGLAALFGGGRSGSTRSSGGGLAALLGGLIGLPGRATGGPVAPGRAYTVGERGPELFVPTASGRIETGAPGASRDIRVAITVNAPPGEGAAAMQRSSRQVARAVRAALAD